MRDDLLCLRPSLLAYLNFFPSPFSPNYHPASLKTTASPHHQSATVDMFASRKRDREEEEDELQHFAPDIKVSAVHCPHKTTLLTQPNRDRLYPSVPHPIPDTSAPSLTHEADHHLSSPKLSRQQILQRKRTRRHSNLQINTTNNINQP